MEQLHLPDLSIRGFRGIDALSISRLGRVTLLAGKNGVGKTTVLDAVRVYAYRGRYAVLRDLLQGREEVAPAVDEEGSGTLEPDWSALFHGWDVREDTCVAIGAGADQLRIEEGYLSVDEVDRVAGLPFHFIADDRLRILRVRFRERQWPLPCFIEPSSSRAAIDLARARVRWSMRHRARFDEPSPEVNCESLGPEPLTNEALAGFWDSVALTEDETRAVSALRLVLGEGVDRVAVVGDDRSTGRGGRGRRAVVRLEGQDRPVPLKSLGDGALRLFGVALALANSRGGFLLVDEVENGIHHSVQRDFWHMVLKTAQENDVQVLATTHSWDCVTGFAQAAIEMEEVEGVLVRLDRDGYGLRAVEYSEEDLKVVVEQGVEVR